MWAKALTCPGTNLVTHLYHGLAQVLPSLCLSFSSYIGVVLTALYQSVGTGAA